MTIYEQENKVIIPTLLRLFNHSSIMTFVGDAVGLMFSALDSGSIRVRDLAGALRCVLGQETLLSQCVLSTQVYEWVPANLMLGGYPAMD